MTAMEAAIQLEAMPESTANPYAEDEARWSSLMAGAQSGDAAAYRQLLDELSTMVERYLRVRLGDHEFLEDCVQEVLLAVHQARHTYDTRRAFRVLETSHPPVFYIPREDIRSDCLVEATRGSFCEFKGKARYVDVRVGDRVAHDAGWFYADPTEAFLPIRDYIAFYPAAMDRCTVDGETVKPQPGEFYGGWVTRDVVGPFKGAPGSEFW